jgi:hypothetical protein
VGNKALAHAHAKTRARALARAHTLGQWVGGRAQLTYINTRAAYKRARTGVLTRVHTCTHAHKVGWAGGAAYAQPEEALAHLVVAQPPAAVHVQDLRRTDGRAQAARAHACTCGHMSR